MARGSKPGERRGGRKKGTPNRAHRNKQIQLRQMVLDALEQAGGRAGGVGYLKTLALTNPNAFASLLGKVLPLQIGGDPDGVPIRKTVEWLPIQD